METTYDTDGQRTQSWSDLVSKIRSLVKNDLSALERKIISGLSEMLQAKQEGKEFGEDCLVTINQEGDAEVTLPLSFLSADTEINEQDQVWNAFSGLQKHTVGYEHDNGQWKSITLIINPGLTDDRKIIFRLHSAVYKVLAGISGEYIQGQAMPFRSKYTKCIYNLLKDKKDPVTYSISELRKLSGAENVYKRLDTFILRVIAQSKKELDDKGTFTFTHKLVMLDNIRKIKGITFTPVSNMLSQNEEPKPHVTAQSQQLFHENPSYKEGTGAPDSEQVKIRYSLEDILHFSGDDLKRLTAFVMNSGGSLSLACLIRECGGNTDETAEWLRKYLKCFSQ